jgi:hypothetical protein
MGVAEVFCCSGKALKFGDGHEIAKMPEFQGSMELFVMLMTQFNLMRLSDWS